MTIDATQRQVRQRVSVAPSPATSGTAFSIDSATDYDFNPFEQTVPFKIAVFPQHETPSKQNYEVILVKAYSASTRTGAAAVQSVVDGAQAQGSVDVTEYQAGSASQSEIQTVTVDATSGTFTLSFGGQTTSALAYNASSSTVQTALQGLSSIGSGNATVSGSAGGPYTVTFAGSLANSSQALITADPTNLVSGGAGSVTIAETTAGAGEVQQVVVYASGGTFKLSFNGQQTSSLAYNASAGTVQSALVGLSTIGTGNCTVSRSGASPAFTFTVTFTGTVANTYLLVADGSSLTFPGDTPSATVSAVSAGVSEVQTVTTSAMYGTFTLSFGGQTTDDLPWDASADCVSTELQLLTSIGSGNVTVESDADGLWTVTFAGTLGNKSQSLMTADASLLTDEGLSGTQTVTIDATAGTFRLSADGGTNYTSALAYNASASTVQTALQGLAAIGSGNCQVALDSTAQVYTVTFTGALANSAPSLLTSDGSSLTVATANVTSCSRAQDNTTARSVTIGDHIEVTARNTYTAVTTASGSGGTITPDYSVSAFHGYEITSSGNVTIAAATNPPTGQGGLLTIYILNDPGNATSTLTWNAAYTFSSISKPTSLVQGAYATVVFTWNEVAQAWQAIATY